MSNNATGTRLLEPGFFSPLGKLADRAIYFLNVYSWLFGEMVHVWFLPRNAMLARGICRRRVSVTLRYCIKTAKCKITQIKIHDSQGLWFCGKKRSSRNSNGITPHGGAKRGWDGLNTKLGHFRRITCCNSKTVQDRCIVSIKVE